MVVNKGRRIAVVEDEKSLRQDLVEYLQLRGFFVQGFESAELLYRVWRDSAFDLAILDIGLPGDSGLQAARLLRARSLAGIVMLTAQGGQSDQVLGLESGADAYLWKTASLQVIEATCRSVLRRVFGVAAPGHGGEASASVADVCGWRLCCKNWRLTVPSGERLDLTHTEMLFLQTLLQRAGTPVNRSELLTILGKADTLSNLRNLDNCASRLRRKISKESGMDIPIRSSYGNGYTFVGEGGLSCE